MKHRGLLHHQIIVVSNLARSRGFYEAMFACLGYERGGRSERYEDWKRWDVDTPHEFSVVQVADDKRNAAHQRGAVGHHHHIALAAADRADVDRFHAEVLVPCAARGLCRILDAPAECPEYGTGYYATFFEDPDGLRWEFVVNESWVAKKRARD